jgi:pilus assembly protein Flp/PilA
MRTPFSRPSRSGATAIEYGLIASLIGVAIVLGAATLGGKINAALNSASTHQPLSGEVLVDSRGGG